MRDFLLTSQNGTPNREGSLSSILRFILRFFLPLFFVVVSTLTLSACSAPERLSVSGSTTVLPAVSRAAESYSESSGQRITVNAGGSGSGFNQLAEGQTDIGMMSRDITKGERAQFPKLTFNTLAVGRDAVAPAVSSEIYDAGVTALTLDKIAEIYRGEIKNWSELGGPDVDIFVIDKEASSGTRQTFMEVVMGNSKADAAGADLVIGSNNEEQTALTQSNAAIGMLSIAWLNEDVKGLSVITENGARIAPTLASVKSGQFPIVRDLNIVVRGDISPAAQRFVDYILSEDGQTHVTASGYIPVR